MDKPKLYVACGLTGAPKDFKERVEELKRELRGQYDILDFIGLGPSTPADVYRHDIACVRNCDGLVAICDLPSTGMGMEISHAIGLGKPVLALASKEASVTRMVTGAAEVEPGVQFARYESLPDMKNLVAELMARH